MFRATFKQWSQIITLEGTYHRSVYNDGYIEIGGIYDTNAYKTPPLFSFVQLITLTPFQAQQRHGLDVNRLNTHAN